MKMMLTTMAFAAPMLIASGVSVYAIALSAPAVAADYQPVTCHVRAAYAGRPLHPPLAIPALEPAPAHALDGSTANRLDAAFERIASLTSATAIATAISIPGKGLWQRVTVPTDAPRLFWASAGKTFTAVVVLQLVEEGKLKLDDPVSRWIDGVPNGKVVTIRDLLAHTGGLFNASEDLKTHAKPRYRALAEELAIVRRHGAMFCPGANWRYSNSGYGLLGEIVRQVDARPLNAAITARIITPLGLTSMRALSPGGGAPGVAPLTSVKEKPMDPSWAGAAGPIVSDAADMVRFWEALLDGRLLPHSVVQEMTSMLYPMFDAGTFYGLGVMVFDVPNGDRPIRWLGHAGGTPGANALVAYSFEEDAIVAVALTGEGSATASANLLLKALSE